MTVGEKGWGDEGGVVERFCGARGGGLVEGAFFAGGGGGGGGAGEG